MGAFGTAEEALKNVAAFRAASAPKKSKQKSTKQSKFGKSEKESKHKKHKSRKRKEDSSSKDKKRPHKRARVSSSSDGDESGSSDTDAEVPSHVQLERGRRAAQVTRHLLHHFPAVRQDLRELLRRVEKREALDISGVPDLELQSQLALLLTSLGLLRSRQGVFVQKHPVILSPLWYIFEEAPEDLARYFPTPVVPVAAADQPTSSCDAAATAAAASTAADAAGGSAAAMGSPAPSASDPAGCSMPVSSSQCDSSHQHGAGYRNDDTQTSSGIKRQGAADGLPQGDTEHPAGQAASEPAVRRMVGPAMPAPEVLAAAAELAEEMQRQAEDDEEDVLGPAPPDMEQRYDAEVGDDERDAEVKRILRLLGEAAAERVWLDPHALLKLEQKDSEKAGTVKKAFWRLSLLVHPDKCRHPRANDVFQAVTKAAEALQDGGERAKVLQRKEDERVRKLELEAAEGDERARQWRVVKGEATADDLAVGRAGGHVQMVGRAAVRDAWMTELPPERQPDKKPSQTSKTSFSQSRVQARGDTSAWTDTPGQKLARLQGLAAASEQAALPSPAEAAKKASDVQAAAKVDQWNATQRTKTLVEVHQERLQAEKKKKRKEAKDAAKADKKAGQQGDGDWEGKHPWRPFDRERDLNSSRVAPQNAQDLLKKQGALSGRFGSTSQRSFL
ncbi:hypothetical protein WJX84_007358 [Apatococcus fuscideae]|uniref:J domain-containing protein n=1 Tax=Apatococcus fuscideae TaxID=2026836 RepID=A0AAW1TL59_9CHLO